MIKRQLFFVSLFLVLAFTVANIAQLYAVMPPEVYREDINESQIKAVAIIKKIQVLEDTHQRTKKNVVFHLVKSFNGNMAKKFEGICYSVDREDQEPMVGGTLYYYPKLNEKVYVTISKNKGNITSLETLSEKFLEEVNLNEHNIYPEGLSDYLKANIK